MQDAYVLEQGRRPVKTPKVAFLLQRTRGRCWYCGDKIIAGDTATIDHIVPKSRGGTSNTANLIPSCAFCNRSKSDLLIDEFRREKRITVFWGETQGPDIAELANSPDMTLVIPRYIDRMSP